MTTLPAPTTGPVSAVAWWGRGSLGLTVDLVPLTSIEEARARFGGGLADARRFVLEIMCNECGVEAMNAAECADCGEPCCWCITDPHHRDTYYCSAACVPDCSCTECDN